MDIYQQLAARYSAEIQEITKKYNFISFARLISIIVFLAAGYFYLDTNTVVYALAGFISLAVFFILMRIHFKISEKRKFLQALLKINNNEIDYLDKKAIPFEDGAEYNQLSHPYAYDLDIFGKNSLFHNLNRTRTFAGKNRLSGQLLTIFTNQEIIDNQEAIKELSAKFKWRQDFMALGILGNDTRQAYDTLLKWSKNPSIPVSRESMVIAFISPAVMFGLLTAYLITSNISLLSYVSFLFVFNLSFTGKFLKRIKSEIQHADGVDKIIAQYSLLVGQLENESFESARLKKMQQLLSNDKQPASVSLKNLSSLFSKMDSIGNFVTTLFFNGLFLFHVHVLKSFIQWKKENADALKQWLDVIGETEMLNSLANFSYNNPEFCFPELNENHEISFSQLSHPLLPENLRVASNVTFQPQSFMILTGSNMSGKSTFLRSLGVNMVLTGIGAPVCASAANVHPMQVLVSMRLSDSLTDSESYFYAEIKRLKQIMDALENNRAFVLLDEILRGTNSDDKRSGTIEVVKKIIGKQAIGAIATHDIEVCLTTNDYPEQLINKCFEVEIIDNDLHFDYQLRDGICRNKSATFLMKKLGVV